MHESKEKSWSYQNAVAERKSLVVAITEMERTEKRSWKRRRMRPPVVPGMPCKSFILTPGPLAAASVAGGASRGCTEGRLMFIDVEGESLLPITKLKISDHWLWYKYLIHQFGWFCMKNLEEESETGPFFLILFLILWENEYKMTGSIPRNDCL